DNAMAIFVEPSSDKVRKELEELGVPSEKIDELTEKKVNKRVHQAMQGVVYNLNTMH
ncbi:Anaerobic ribonucleoside-triphosphate reductase, partial [human gut metagenome]